MEQLLANLNEQLSVITTLTELTRQERDAIAGKDAALMQQTLHEKERLQAVLSTLEEKRSILSDGLTLRELAALPDAPSEELLTLRETLQAALRELHNENTTNMVYLKNELAYLTRIREAITPETADCYTKNGALATKQQPTEPMISTKA